jgi:superfamily II DNA or RNA helicase
MQALCPACNLKKGANTMTKQDRPHQAEMRQHAISILAGTSDKKIITAEVTPGGGKTGMATIGGHDLIYGGDCDALIWAVPRTNLASQVVAEFNADETFNPSRYRIEACNSKTPLIPRGAIGGVASYQQIGRNPEAFIHFFQTNRCLLICDEYQMISGDEEFSEGAPGWSNSIIELINLSHRSVLMGGLFYRADNKRIPFLEYEERNGKLFAKTDIRYQLDRGIADLSIRTPEFQFLNADVTWNEGGRDVQVDLAKSTSKTVRKALKTFLKKPETWKRLIDDGVTDLLSYRARQPDARLIIVALDQKFARKIRDYVTDKHKLDVLLAICQEGNAADEGLHEFRTKNRYDALVTVGKASIGFDAPNCTHMVYLSDFRTLSWALQAFGRVWRTQDVNDCGIQKQHQFCRITLPDDPLIREIVAWVQNAIEIGMQEREKHPSRVSAPPTPGVAWFPVSAIPGEVSFSTHQYDLDPTLAAELAKLRKELPFTHSFSLEHCLDTIRYFRTNESGPVNNSHSMVVNRKDLTARLHTLSNQCDRIAMRAGDTFRGKPWGWGCTEAQKPKGWVASASIEELQARIDELEARMAVRRGA